MPNRTHSKKQPPKGFPFDRHCATGKKNKLVSVNDVHLPETVISNLMDSCCNNFLISRAYSEPTGHDFVENMLLQRDYIID